MTGPLDTPLPPRDGRWWQTTGKTEYACPGCGTQRVAAPVVSYRRGGWYVQPCLVCSAADRTMIQATLQQVTRWGVTLGPWQPSTAQRGTGRSGA